MKRALVHGLLITCLACGGGQGANSGDAGADATQDAQALDASTDGSVDAAASDSSRDASLDAALEPDASTDAGPALLGPPYPIVLAHGFFGFEDFAGIDFINYFFRVKDRLASDGELLVFTPAVDPFGSSEERGRQLLDAVERITRETGYAKVNLICHSQGGLDARVVAALRPDLVASVTTVATPHAGTPVADALVRITDYPRLSELLDAFVRLIGAPIYDALGADTSVTAAIRQLSTEGMAEFNAMYPPDPDMPYFSIAGRSDNHPGGADCEAVDSPRFITRWRRDLDPIDPLFALPETINDGVLVGPGHANDGMVRAIDARFGRFLGCIPADHMDEVGHLFGDSPGLGNDFDYLDFWSELIAWLRAQGY
ncbi:MAG: alpha/beta fold hydrolase [Deltaproteobacteria bacterium]|nr:alpha/beta fold hydrolase [Deltaproteobacteria bacterium]